MNILILEDRGSVLTPMEEALRDEGYEVFSALGVNDAKDIWEKKKIHCIIADLNMRQDGLKPDEADTTLGGLLTGWVWLREYIYRYDPSMKQRTIIYTEYMSELERNIPSKELEGIFCIAKRDSLSSAERVFGRVQEIAQMVDERGRGAS